MTADTKYCIVQICEMHTVKSSIWSGVINFTENISTHLLTVRDGFRFASSYAVNANFTESAAYSIILSVFINNRHFPEKWCEKWCDGIEKIRL